MKKLLLMTIGTLMVVSLAACSPTTGQDATLGTNQNEPQTQAKEVVEKLPDATAPVLESFNIYYLNQDKTGLKQGVDGVEVMDADSLVDKLIEYEVLAPGTMSLDFTTEGEGETAVTGPGQASNITTYSSAVLDVSEFPEENRDLLLIAVANTFTESMNIDKLTISIDGEVIGTDLTFTEGYAKLK